jgi:hypothetical protein
MPGKPDPLYVAARGVLLDALGALGSQRKAVILIGAQAIYLHTGATEFAVAEYTTDADIALDPAALETIPEIESAMTSAGFYRGNRVGAWCVSRDVGGVNANIEVDLMVPEAVGGAGSRAARLAGHAKHVARKARGLEASLIDKTLITIDALDPEDRRSFNVAVAGPAALIVSKLHKIQERLAERGQRRVDAKDALDVFRLLRAIPTAELAKTFSTLLQSSVSGKVAAEALEGLKALFTNPRADGCQMAVRAAGPVADPDEITGSCVVLTNDLVAAIQSGEGK